MDPLHNDDVVVCAQMWHTHSAHRTEKFSANVVDDSCRRLSSNTGAHDEPRTCPVFAKQPDEPDAHAARGSSDGSAQFGANHNHYGHTHWHIDDVVVYDDRGNRLGTAHIKIENLPHV